jgi:hypothetical protein
MRLLWVVIALAVLATGCRKRSAPEFYRLESDVEVLASRDGDDAWVSPEMEGLGQRLGAIPADAVEAPRAVALAARIVSERDRVVAERAQAQADRNRPAPTMAAMGLGGEAMQAQPSATVAPAAAPDAGPSEPVPGMELKAFLRAFADCMELAPVQDVPTVGKASAYLVKSLSACQTKFKVPNDQARRYYLFVADRLVGERTEQRVASPAPAADAGPRAP